MKAKSKVFQQSLIEERFNELEVIANSQGRTVQEIIRQLVGEYLTYTREYTSTGGQLSAIRGAVGRANSNIGAC